MQKKQIKLLNKKVNVAYCYATEINYNELAGEPAASFMVHAYECLSKTPVPEMPDIKKSIFMIIAAITACCDFEGKDVPFEYKDLLFKATPEEIGTAIGVVIGLHAKFYKLPFGEPDNKESKNNEAEGKNA